MTLPVVTSFRFPLLKFIILFTYYQVNEVHKIQNGSTSHSNKSDTETRTHILMCGFPLVYWGFFVLRQGPQL